MCDDVKQHLKSVKQQSISLEKEKMPEGSCTTEDGLGPYPAGFHSKQPSGISYSIGLRHCGPLHVAAVRNDFAVL